MRRSLRSNPCTRHARVRRPRKSRSSTSITTGAWMRRSRRRAVDFITRETKDRQARSLPTCRSGCCTCRRCPNPEFSGKTGNGDWADCLAELDYRTGQILDAIKRGGIENDTLVIFASDNGPEALTPGKATAARGAAPTSRRWKPRCARPSSFGGRAECPLGASATRSCTSWIFTRPLPMSAARRSRTTGPIDGVDQSDFFLGKQENSNREGFPAYVADRLSAVKWRNWKMHLIKQETCTTRRRSFRCRGSSTC